jgi:hypothetical protein
MPVYSWLHFGNDRRIRERVRFVEVRKEEWIERLGKGVSLTSSLLQCGMRVRVDLGVCDCGDCARSNSGYGDQRGVR